MATARELEPVGVSEKKAFQIIEAARSSLGISFVRADELYKMRQTVLRLTTGSKAVDKMVDGGLETQTITEFYGEYGSGKSQFCHQLCVNVQLPPERGGLNGAALYVDTENTFRLERIIQMSKHLGLDPEQVVKNIIYAEAFTSDHQMFLLENADEIIKANNIKLIIVDSLTAHFRSCNSATIVFTSGKKPRAVEVTAAVDPYLEEDRAFISAVRSGRGVAATIEEGFAGLRMVSGVRESSGMNGRPVRM